MTSSPSASRSPVIDAHTHAFAPAQAQHRDALAERDPTFAEMYADPAAKMATVGDVPAAMDRAGFDAAVVAGFAFATQRDIDEQNEHLLAGLQTYPGRIAVLATVNPALAGWERAAEAALDAGARGFGELRPWNQGWDPLGPEGSRLCAFARERNAVLLWHCSEPVGHAYPGKQGGIRPEELYRVAESFPSLKMVGAHFGGGLPFYLQMPGVKDILCDVSFDTAAASLLYDEHSVSRLVELAGPEHVLFASDYPLLSPKRQLRRVQAGLPEGAAEAVCGGNASQLFEI